MLLPKIPYLRGPQQSHDPLVLSPLPHSRIRTDENAQLPSSQLQYNSVESSHEDANQQSIVADNNIKLQLVLNIYDDGSKQMHVNVPQRPSSHVRDASKFQNSSESELMLVPLDDSSESETQPMKVVQRHAQLTEEELFDRAHQQFIDMKDHAFVKRSPDRKEDASKGSCADVKLTTVPRPQVERHQAPAKNASYGMLVKATSAPSIAKRKIPAVKHDSYVDRILEGKELVFFLRISF